MATTTTKKAKEEQEAIEKITMEALANKIVNVVTHELHIRNGIGPIWRQLHATRKKEILDKWNADIEKLLVEHVSK